MRLPCGQNEFCIPKSNFSPEHHLNRPEIQRQLGLPRHIDYLSINFTFNAAFTSHPDVFIPTTNEVSFLLDKGGLSVLVLNGNADAVV